VGVIADRFQRQRVLMVSQTLLMTLALGLGALVLLGLASIAYLATANATVQLAVPEHLTGRIMGLWVVVNSGTMPLGSLLLGALAERLHLSGVFLLAGGGTLLPAAVRERAIQLTSQIRLFDVRDVQLTDETFAAIERMTHWQAGLAMVRDSPWIGVGVGTFNIRFPEFSPHPAFRISQGHAHNYYLHAAAETGLLGLAAYLLVLLLALAAALRAARQGWSPLDRALGLGALAATTAVMVHNVVENLHVLNLSAQLAAVWGLAIMAEVGRPAVRADSRAARGEGQRSRPS